MPGSQLPWYWVELGFVYPNQLALVAFVVAAGFVVGLDFRQLFGPLPDRKGWGVLVRVHLLLFGLGSALLFAIYLPLSYVVPGFVRWWLDWAFMPSVYLEADGSLPLLANVLSGISVGVLAPLLEELLFRGFLLHRWAAKFLETGRHRRREKPGREVAGAQVSKAGEPECGRLRRRRVQWREYPHRPA